MSDDSPVSSLTGEEVAFWRGFIEWWSREKEEPVPTRAWAALSHAEARHAETSEFRSASQFDPGMPVGVELLVRSERFD